MSPGRRRKMVDREHPSLPIVRQCALLGVSRSSLYYHANYSIDTKNCGIRGQWTYLSRRLSRTDPLETSWVLWVAKTNFKGETQGSTETFDPGRDQHAVPHCLHAWEALSTAICGARWTQIGMVQGPTDLEVT